MTDDPWAVLGLTPATPPDEVRRRWLALAKALHPDRGGDPLAAARLAEVNAAYTTVMSADREPAEDAATGATGGTAMFSVAALRAAVFDALVLASTDLGDVTDSDEPFSLDLRIDGGLCHVELTPEAGGSVVTIDSEQLDPVAVGQALVAGLVAVGLGAALA